MRLAQLALILPLAARVATQKAAPVNASTASCVWPGSNSSHDVCRSSAYSWHYPACALFQRPDDPAPIPCQGAVDADYCAFGDAAKATAPPPQPASWHVHVFFPNDDCTNCSAAFRRERPPTFTRAGAMELRSLLAAKLNELTALLRSSRPALDPINVSRAATDDNYDQCIDSYHIVAGAPARLCRVAGVGGGERTGNRYLMRRPDGMSTVSAPGTPQRHVR